LSPPEPSETLLQRRGRPLRQRVVILSSLLFRCYERVVGFHLRSISRRHLVCTMCLVHLPSLLVSSCAACASSPNAIELAFNPAYFFVHLVRRRRPLKCYILRAPCASPSCVRTFVQSIFCVRVCTHTVFLLALELALIPTFALELTLNPTFALELALNPTSSVRTCIHSGFNLAIDFAIHPASCVRTFIHSDFLASELALNPTSSVKACAQSDF
jgi:hypothetical protein